MSVSSLDSLQHNCSPSHEQQIVHMPRTCYAPNYNSPESASMDDEGHGSFVLDSFERASFMKAEPSYLGSALSLDSFPDSNHEDTSRCSKSDAASPDQLKITSERTQYSMPNGTNVGQIQDLRQVQATYIPYSRQIYQVRETWPAADHHQYAGPGAFSHYLQLGHINSSPSPCSTSPTLQHSPSLSWPSPGLINEDRHHLSNPSNLVFPRCDYDEDDSLNDKPYARLIYEALMQAPGHRMMLRDIYEWFQKNTTKPSESGSNGWQNSIRHNLSMNQAFENDKSDPSSRGRGGDARKSNSVWVLTDAAVRNGVQSTTRYRKTGNAKKANLESARVPAPQRQRSGAKGGQAARRAAKMRRREEAECLKHISPEQISPCLSGYNFNESYGYTRESDYLSTYNTESPPDDHLFVVQNVLSRTSCSAELPAFEADELYMDDKEQHVQELGHTASSDNYIEDLLTLHQDSSSMILQRDC